MFKLASGYFLTTEDASAAIASFKDVEIDGKLFASETAVFFDSTAKLLRGGNLLCEFSI